MAEISNQEDFEKWLEDKPREVAVVLAARTALRILPTWPRILTNFTGTKHNRRNILLPVLRAKVVTLFAGTWPNRATEEVRRAATRATVATATARAIAATARATTTARATATTARATAATARATAATAATAAATAATAAVNAARAYDADLVTALWGALSQDCTSLEESDDETFSTRATALSQAPLWPGGNLSTENGHTLLTESGEPIEVEGSFPPSWVRETWPKMKSDLEAIKGENWWVWTDWYQAILDGKPINSDVEEARVLLPDDLWDNDPAAVNAELARLIAEHGWDYSTGRAVGETPGESEDPPPELPPEKATPVSFVYRGEVLDIADPPPAQVDARNQAALSAARTALAQFFDDVLAGRIGRQMPKVSLVLERCRDALGTGMDDLNVIGLGLHGDRLVGIAERASEEMLSVDAAELRKLAAQHGLFLAHFPQWRDYLAAMQDFETTAQAEQEAVVTAATAVRALEEAAPDLLSPDAKAELEAQIAEAQAEPTPDNPNPVAPEVPRRGFLRSFRALVRTMLGSYSGAMWEGHTDGVKAYSKTATFVALTGMTGYLAALATGLAPEFAWLVPYIEKINQLLLK